MNKASKIVVVLALLIVLGGVLWLKQARQTNVEKRSGTAPPVMATTSAPNGSGVSTVLPRMVDLGADKCIPCKMMMPILAALKAEYTGYLQVDFIDVWKNPEEAPKYKVTTIPTQIFFDPNGKELFRHVGYFAQEDILAQWRTLGYEFDPPELGRTEPSGPDTEINR